MNTVVVRRVLAVEDATDFTTTPNEPSAKHKDSPVLSDEKDDDILG